MTLGTRLIDDGEAAEFHRVLALAFGHTFRADRLEVDLTVFEPDRSFAAFDGPTMVGTATAQTRNLAVPGGLLPAAGIRAVAVLPTHRRRGILAGLMRAQFDDIHERGEPLAALWSTEHRIYGRFGFGIGTRAENWALVTEGTDFVPAAPVEGSVQLLEFDDAVDRVIKVFDRIQRFTPGLLDRSADWWRRRFEDPPASTLCALVADAAGEDQGYALYRVAPMWGERGPENDVHVLDSIAEPRASAALWRFLLDLDLAARVDAILRPVDDPLPLLLADARRLRRTVAEGMWVRTVDVRAALAGRRYSTAVDTVIEVIDETCPWNQGAWHLSGDSQAAGCERSSDHPHVTTTAAGLAAMYLGATRAGQLATAGWLTEHRAGATAALDAAFASTPLPWGGTWF